MKPRDILMAEETLFRGEEVFTPSYVPEDFTHRDDQIRAISLSLKPGLRGVNPVNTLVHGPPGTGKTTAVKYIFNEAAKTSGKLAAVYVNCDDYNTRFSIFARIHEAVIGHAPPDTGKPLNAVKEKVFRKLQKDGRSLVVALDEIDQLFLNNTIDSLLLDILKAHTTYGYDKVGVVGILIDENILLGLDPKTASVYNPVKVYFPPYTLSEAKDILSTRVRYGLYDGVLSDELLDYVVEKTVEAADMRVGIDLIRRSALLAEKDASRRITREHVLEAYERDSRKVGLRKAVASLDGVERKLLSLIASDDGIRSGELYLKLRGEAGTGVKKYNQIIAKLENAGLVESAPLPGPGQSRQLKLRHAGADVLEQLR